MVRRTSQRKRSVTCGIVHDAAGESGQEFQRVVTAPFSKFLAKICRPVLAADFVAVNERAVERLAGERAEVVEDFLHEARPMRVERRLAELVTLQALAFHGRGMIFHAGRRVADAQNGPAALRHVPLQLASCLPIGRSGPPSLRARSTESGASGVAAWRRHDKSRRCRRPWLHGLEFSRFAVGRGKGEHGDIPIKIQRGGRLRQQAAEIRRASHAHFAGRDALHRVVRRVPRSAAAGPAGAIFHADFESQPVRFLDGEFEIRPPFRDS